ncbi:hypothetical protein DVA81_19830, partial [Acinetobacter baumannii]
INALHMNLLTVFKFSGFVLFQSKVSGRGFHRTLRCVVENGGTFKPKKGKQINLNVKLASSLTDSIDEEFKKTFP